MHGTYQCEEKLGDEITFTVQGVLKNPIQMESARFYVRIFLNVNFEVDFLLNGSILGLEWKDKRWTIINVHVNESSTSKIYSSKIQSVSLAFIIIVEWNAWHIRGALHFITFNNQNEALGVLFRMEKVINNSSKWT